MRTHAPARSGCHAKLSRALLYLKGPHGAPFHAGSSRPAALQLLSWPAAAHTRCHHVAAAAERRSEAASGIESLDAASSLWWLAAWHLAVSGIAAYSKVNAEAVYGHDGRGDARPWQRF